MAISSKQGRRRRRVRSWYGVLIAAFALVVPLLALAESVPINLQAAIFMRALAYEKGFVADTSPALILVLGGGKAQKDATEMVAALHAIHINTQGVISILQSIKAAGALRGELVIQ